MRSSSKVFGARFPPLLPTPWQVGLVHELWAEPRSLLALHPFLPIPDLGQRREGLVLALLELTFQLGRPTDACEIREIHLAIDTWCENAEGIQKKGCDLGFLRVGNLQEKVHLECQEGRDPWQGKNMSTTQKAGITGVAAGEHHRNWAELKRRGDAEGWWVMERVAGP